MTPTEISSKPQVPAAAGSPAAPAGNGQPGKPPASSPAGPAGGSGQRPLAAAPAAAPAAPPPPPAQNSTEKRGPGRPPLTAAPGRPPATQPTQLPAKPSAEAAADLAKKYEVAGKRIGEINLAMYVAGRFLEPDFKEPSEEERKEFHAAGAALCEDMDWRKIPGLLWLLSVNISFILSRIGSAMQLVKKMREKWSKKKEEPAAGAGK